MVHEPRLGCGAAVLDGDAVLLIQRRVDPEAGHWGFPGGKVEWLEQVEQAVKRETREEVGINLRSCDLLCVVDEIGHRQATHWVSIVYWSARFDGTAVVVEPEKHSGIGWFPLDALPEPLATSVLAALPKLLDIVSTGHRVPT